MNRTIRPIGPVSATLAKAGYRQYAAIFVDGKQVPNVAVLSTIVEEEVKFVGHWIDANGEVHKTKPMKDMKRSASRILGIIEHAPAPAHSSKPTPQSIGAMIECRGCGTRHSDDTLCPE